MKGGDLLGKWGAIAYAVSSLQPDAHLDIPDFPRGAANISRLRGGIRSTSAGRMLRFLVRSLPSGGVRIIRTGEYGSLWIGTEGSNSETRHPVLAHKIAARVTELRPGCFFLGLLWDTSNPNYPSIPRCNEKACPYPATCGETCSRHQDDTVYFYDTRLDRVDMIAPKEYPYLPLTLYVGRIAEDERGWLYAIQQRSDGYQVKHTRAERLNDKWWQENVVDKGLITDIYGVVHKIASERELNHLIEKPGKVLAESESLRAAAKFFGMDSGRYKMRRGGGRGKIRKKQRQRPAGWHGSRDDTKSNRPDRTTLDSSQLADGMAMDDMETLDPADGFSWES